MNVPQFGAAEVGAVYPDRPAAFALIESDGLIALVQVERQGRGLVVDLPGGGIDPGETAGEAAVRECGEEAGLVVAVAPAPFVRADHYFLHNDGVVRNTRGAFFVGRMTGEDLSLKIEADHERVWMEPQAALVQLDRDSHAWALAYWLRLRARG